jgi:hypothetical protein
MGELSCVWWSAGRAIHTGVGVGIVWAWVRCWAAKWAVQSERGGRDLFCFDIVSDGCSRRDTAMDGGMGLLDAGGARGRSGSTPGPQHTDVLRRFVDPDARRA